MKADHATDRMKPWKSKIKIKALICCPTDTLVALSPVALCSNAGQAIPQWSHRTSLSLHRSLQLVQSTESIHFPCSRHR